MLERRTQPRFEVSIDVDVEGMNHTARVTDLSEGGCYIDAPIDTFNGELVQIRIKLPNGERLQLTGEVAHHFPRLGLGIRFKDLDETTRSKIALLIPTAQPDENIYIPEFEDHSLCI